jgi:hypothetical protein
LIVSLRSPVPLLVAGVCVALVVIAAVTVLSQPPAAGQVKVATMGDREALAIVAGAMRTGESAAQIMNLGQANFDDGSWYITVDGGAQLHFSQRNRIVVADNDAAVKLMFSN